jgi:cytochrome c-type biogenesis protein CcmH
VRRLALALCAWLAFAFAAPHAAASGPVQSAAPLEFRDNAEETRFRHLAAQLRCVMCQNQSLADSDAPIAHDLRRQVLALMREGRSDEQIRTYLVQRYSEFVLYAPRLRPGTWLLWFGPPVLLVGGLALIAAIVRRRARTLPAVATSTPSVAEPESEEEW